ncbi:RNA polymerase sigma-70 factor (ECF subfamily) [Melghiribacillus thermohalophilus]|uniref:RNA polymerase sigma-70 factor (ECF subfamily) n=1 Tax=Melghiribacillus thermohalophilus TaxID=1324956 RepID=A0A4V2V254_9BACI|nr:sigma-70 family RNA polymerase sigma factor [Melghiribacillus thermohalophilus]TCT23662.1 RNA polymerase sigma-70 factor (ECF subfamily) [Melghiribacillus thermohalophilus]
MSYQSDEQLIEGMKKGSIEDFHLFYERHMVFTYKIVYSLLKNREEAQDICHDLFIEFFTKAHTYNPEKGSVKAWIAVKAKTRTIDYIRRNKKILLKQNMIYSNDVAPESVEDVAVTRMESMKMKNLLKQLPEKQQEAIIYNYFQSMTHQEIADKLGRPLGTVKSLIRYGLQNLKKSYFRESSNRRRGRYD